MNMPRNPNQAWIEDLKYSIDVFDEGDNLVEVIGRIHDLVPARAAFAAAIGKYPEKHISLRDGARVLGRSDEPPEWLTAHRPVPVFEQKPAALPDAAAGRPLAPDKRPQDRSLDGRGLTFKTLEHGGEEPDTMPNAIRMTDPLGRSALYVVLKIDGKAVDPDSIP